uniref:Uncharacterized protein n=1 Tax=Magallana gigas TaxID=29159 RepID=K1PC93_MAGGI
MYHFYHNHDETTDCHHHCYHNHCPIADKYACFDQSRDKEIYLYQSWSLHHSYKGTSRSLVMTQNTTVMEGQRVVLKCRTPNNEPDVTFHWIKRVSGVSNFIQSIGRELVIESAKVADTGIYVCLVGNNIGMKMKSVDVWLTVKRTTTSTTTTTTTEAPTTTTTSTTTTAGLKINGSEVVQQVSFTLTGSVAVQMVGLPGFDNMPVWGFAGVTCQQCH